MSMASSPEHMVGRDRTLMSFFLGSELLQVEGRNSYTRLSYPMVLVGRLASLSSIALASARPVNV